MELQEPAEVMMISFHILLLTPEPKPLQIMSTTFKAEGVHLGLQQLQELKALNAKWDEKRTKVTAEEDWCGLLDPDQFFFWALSIPFRLAHLLR